VRVRVGVIILPDRPWSEAATIWRRAEEMRFAHAWTYDHLAWRSLRDTPWFAAMPTLTAAATVTDRIRLGTLVASPNFRHPLTFAKELVALDDISGGRVTAGVGAGSDGWDATMLGQAPPWSPSARAARYAEFVELADRVLREPAGATYRGRYYSCEEARTLPGCVQQPRVPFALAAAGPKAMAVAATFGAAWVTTGDRATEGPLDSATGAAIVRRQIEHLAAACERIGRDPDTIDRIVVTGPQLDPCLGSPEEFRDATGRYADAGVTDLVVHWPRPSPPFDYDPRGFERVFSGEAKRA
jgi:alkanesulfonate monooxygenase SsuD/methylene tetrahydromethanopterin reductase-like flavin-dependent oxidoreductase (luciferase family)